MRSNADLLCWARAWKWPYLVLSEQDRTYIPYGEENWRAFVARKDRKSKLQAWQRIHRWTALTEEADEEQPVDRTA